MTLARYFNRLRHESGLSLRAIAAKARPKLDPATIWKIVHGKPIKAETLGVALRALGYTERDQTYIEAFSLWSTEKSGNLPLETVGAGMAAARKKNGQEFTRTLNRLAVALRAMPETDWPILIEAAQRPAALKLWLQSTKADR